MMRTRREPLRLAINGKPAAGQTNSDEPIARNKSQDSARSCARCIRASFRSGATLSRYLPRAKSGFATDGTTVYFGDNTGICYGYGLNGDGWRFAISAVAVNIPPVVAGEMVFFADAGGQLHPTRCAHTALRWCQEGRQGACGDRDLRHGTDHLSHCRSEQARFARVMSGCGPLRGERV